MNIGGITGSYSAWYENSRLRNTQTDAGFGDRVQATGGRAGMTLHWFENEKGETPIGASGLATGGSMTVYEPKDFDPSNPVYHVRVWGADGSMTEQMIDISEVDPRHCSYVEMFAYASHLSHSGACPEAQMDFIGSSFNPHGPGSVYRDPQEKLDWLECLKQAMQQQYDAGNLAGCMRYKKLWDYLTLHADEKAQTEAFGEQEAETKTDFMVKPDGSRIMVITTTVGGTETTMSLEISKPTDMPNDTAPREYDRGIEEQANIGKNL